MSTDEAVAKNRKQRELYKDYLYGIALGYEQSSNILKHEAVICFLNGKENNARILRDSSTQLRKEAELQRKEADSYKISAE